MDRKRKVQAQRKFAQGVPIPPNNVSNSEPKIDVAPNKEEQRNVVRNNTDVKALLDNVSFRNLHIHKEPVVVLERLTNSQNTTNTMNQRPYEEPHEPPTNHISNRNPSDLTADKNFNRLTMILRSRIDNKNKNQEKHVLMDIVEPQEPTTESHVFKQNIKYMECMDHNQFGTVDVPLTSIPDIENFCNLNVGRNSDLNVTTEIIPIPYTSKSINHNNMLDIYNSNNVTEITSIPSTSKSISSNMSDISIDEDQPLSQYCERRKASLIRQQAVAGIKKQNKTAKKTSTLKRDTQRKPGKGVTDDNTIKEENDLKKLKHNILIPLIKRERVCSDISITGQAKTYCPIQNLRTLAEIMDAPVDVLHSLCRSCRDCIKMNKFIQLRTMVNVSKTAIKFMTTDCDSSDEEYIVPSPNSCDDWLTLNLDILKRSKKHMLCVSYCKLKKVKEQSKPTLFCSLVDKLTSDTHAVEAQYAKAILEYLEKHFYLLPCYKENIKFEIDNERVCIGKNNILYFTNNNPSQVASLKSRVIWNSDSEELNKRDELVLNDIVKYESTDGFDNGNCLRNDNELSVPQTSNTAPMMCDQENDNSRLPTPMQPMMNHMYTYSHDDQSSVRIISDVLVYQPSDTRETPIEPQSTGPTASNVYSENLSLPQQFIPIKDSTEQNKNITTGGSKNQITPTSNHINPNLNFYSAVNKSQIGWGDTSIIQPSIPADNVIEQSNFNQMNINISNVTVNPEYSRASGSKRNATPDTSSVQESVSKLTSNSLTVGSCGTSQNVMKSSDYAHRLMNISNTINTREPTTPEGFLDTNTNCSTPIDTSRNICKPSTSASINKNSMLRSKPVSHLQPATGQSFLNAPVFTPTAAEFNDPVKFFDSIMPIASKYGICKVVPPKDFRPLCILNDEMMFNVTNQYITRLYSRWGPGSREMSAIKAYLASQSVFFKRAPLYEGMEVNLPRLYQLVQRHGGLKKVIERKLWNRIAEEIGFTRGPNPEKKLDQLYCKYLLPYGTLSSTERGEIMSRVERAWCERYRKMTERAFEPLNRQNKILEGSESSEEEEESESTENNPHITKALTEAEECVTEGRKMNVTTFKKVASSALETFFPNMVIPILSKLEREYWRLLLIGSEHLCVISASIDTGTSGYGFTDNRYAPYGSHPWNLKNLVFNTNNILRYLGPVLGVTVPTLNLGMVFSTSCWHRDPHGLPWMEYMHEGAPKIWYGIPDTQSERFRKAVESLCPTSCQNKTIWLPSDIAMIPPNLLREQNVILSRVEQKPGEFIIVFPNAYSSSICTGFTVSECVYFASKLWLRSALQFFMEAQISCEPTMFSLESLLISIVTDMQTPLAVLQPSLTAVNSLLEDECCKRYALEDELPAHAANTAIKHLTHPPGIWNARNQDECDVCRKSLFLSRVRGLTKDDTYLCLEHATSIISRKINHNRSIPPFELHYFISNRDISSILNVAKNRLLKII